MREILLNNVLVRCERVIAEELQAVVKIIVNGPEIFKFAVILFFGETQEGLVDRFV
jgi:hypothetical protein